MELALTIQYLAKQHDIEEVDFRKDVTLFDDGKGPYIKDWKLPFSRPTKKELRDAEPLAVAERNDLAYKNYRAEAYPPIGEQLDMMYWDKVNGTSVWKDMVTTIKQTYPKG